MRCRSRGKAFRFTHGLMHVEVTHRPLRLSMLACKPKYSLEALPLLLHSSFTSWWVLLSCVDKETRENSIPCFL